MTKTIPAYFDYLNEMPLALLEQELETATTHRLEAQREVTNASSYGGFPAKLKIARRKQSAAHEHIKYIKQVLTERQDNGY